MVPHTTTIGPQTQVGDAIFDAVFERSLHFRIQMEYEEARQLLRRE